MSRYDGPDEPADRLDGEITNCDCADCGLPFYRSAFDACPWCGPCAVRRDDWITAFELRRMAKAVLSIDLTKVRDIA